MISIPIPKQRASHLRFIGFTVVDQAMISEDSEGLIDVR